MRMTLRSHEESKKKEVYFPNPRCGLQISSSAFLSRRPFRYSQQAIVPNSQPNEQAIADLKLWFKGHKCLTAHSRSFLRLRASEAKRRSLYCSAFTSVLVFFRVTYPLHLY